MMFGGRGDRGGAVRRRGKSRKRSLKVNGNTLGEEIKGRRRGRMKMAGDESVSEGINVQRKILLVHTPLIFKL